MTELNIGLHCSLSSCNRLDFLPFECDGCSLVFCLEHRSKTTHQCSQENITLSEPNSGKSFETYSCSNKDCSNTELVPVKCSQCGKQFCLEHRIPEDHSCINIPGKRQGTTSTPKQIKMKTKFKTVKAEKLAAKVSLIKLKMNAKGDKSYPEEERVYLSVSLHQSSAAPKPFYVSEKWTVGRTIDFFAAKLGIINNNNKATDSKLKLFSVRNNTFFKFDEKLCDLLKAELLFNGSTVILATVSTNQSALEH